MAVVLGWLLVLGGAGVLAFLWLSRDSIDPVDSAQILGTVVAVVVMVSGGCGVLWRWARSRSLAMRFAADQFAVGTRRGQLPRIGQIDLSALGVRVPRRGANASCEQLPYAPRHQMDPRLRAALEQCEFVLVHGPSASGKSRSTAEAARALYGNRSVVVPVVRPGALSGLLAANVVGDGTVVWLDDLERHIAVGVDTGVLRSLLSLDRVIVVATIRAAAYEDLKPQGELRSPGTDVLEFARARGGLVEFSAWDDVDRMGAAERYAGQSDVVTALTAGIGLGEYLVVGPELVERVDTGSPPADGVAVVRAAADWFSVGMTRPAPVDLVRRLYPLYLPTDDASLLDCFDQGLRWASTPVSGARVVTRLTDGSGLVVHDYYLDHSAELSLYKIPVLVWDTLADELSDSPAEQSMLGRAAYESGVVEKAEPLYRAAAEDGDTKAMNNLGFLLAERGDPAEAERWYRAAANSGSELGMYNLAVVLDGQNERDEAERWYRASADAGYADAMNNLAILLGEQGDDVEAAKWFRAAVDAGKKEAMYNLAVLLHQASDSLEAEAWFRRVAETGQVDAMFNLGVLLSDRGQDVEAEGWYRAAAETGHLLAISNLGSLLYDAGSVAEAEHWYRAAADAGNVTAMTNLGGLLWVRGDLGDAERCYRKAANGGDLKAINNLGTMLYQRGEIVEAESWYRSAAYSDEPSAMHNLAILMENQGDLERAERWYRSAAAAGVEGARDDLRNLLLRREDLQK